MNLGGRHAVLVQRLGGAGDHAGAAADIHQVILELPNGGENGGERTDDAAIGKTVVGGKA